MCVSRYNVKSYQVKIEITIFNDEDNVEVTAVERERKENKEV